MAKSDGEAPPQQRGIVRSLLSGLSKTFIALFSLVGVAATVVTATGYYLGAPLSPQAIEGYLTLATPTKEMLSWAWSEAKFLIQHGAFLIGAVALLLAVARIRTVATLIRDFIEARGPIYQLSTTITQAERNSRELMEAVERVSGLKETIERSAERVEEALLKIGDLERLAVVDAPVAQTDEEAGAVSANAVRLDANKERLREIWNANGRRLDDAMRRIPDRRLRKSFSQMSKRNYAAIIDALFKERLITPAAHKASSELHATFMAHRSPKRQVSDRLVGDMLVLDELLEQELSPRQSSLPPEPADLRAKQQVVETRDSVDA